MRKKQRAQAAELARGIPAAQVSRRPIVGRTVDLAVAAPEEYNAAADKNNPYVAETGKTLVAVKYTVTNNGRTSEELYKGGFFTVKYDGKAYPAVPIGVLHLHASNKADSVLVGAGDTETHRAYAEIGVDVEDLSDGFTITVQIPNSDGKTEKFTYTID